MNSTNHYILAAVKCFKTLLFSLFIEYSQFTIDHSLPPSKCFKSLLKENAVLLLKHNQVGNVLCQYANKKAYINFDGKMIVVDQPRRTYQAGN